MVLSSLRLLPTLYVKNTYDQPLQPSDISKQEVHYRQLDCTTIKVVSMLVISSDTFSVDRIIFMKENILVSQILWATRVLPYLNTSPPYEHKSTFEPAVMSKFQTISKILSIWTQHYYKNTPLIQQNYNYQKLISLVIFILVVSTLHGRSPMSFVGTISNKVSVHFIRLISFIVSKNLLWSFSKHQMMRSKIRSVKVYSRMRWPTMIYMLLLSLC